MPPLLIANGTLVTDTAAARADLLIEGEKIKEVSPHIHAPEAQVVDASGLLVLPGGVDPHTHFDLPMFATVSSDDHYTGHKAAAFGGTTTVIDFVSFDFPTLKESIQAWQVKSAKAAVDYSFHMNLTRFDDEIAREIPSLPDLGITTLKVFTAYNGRLRLEDENILKALEIACQHGMLVLAHCEDGDEIEALIAAALRAGHTTPEWHALTRTGGGAVAATRHIFDLAAQSGAPVYIVHMNVAGEADALRSARVSGIQAMGETCPQYLFFTEDELRRPEGAKWVCSPPVRSSADNLRLWDALSAGEIQVVATDHCPFFYDGTRPILYEGKEIAIPGKELGAADFTRIPNGLPGVGDRLPVLWTEGVVSGRLTAQQFVALNSTNPAKIFGLYPRKGALLPGSDADIVLWDPRKVVEYGLAYSHHRTDYNLYEGWHLTGMPAKVFLRGRLIVDGDQWLGASGMGEFLPREPFAPVI